MLYFVRVLRVSPLYFGKNGGTFFSFKIIMQSRDIESFGMGLTDEQVLLKKQMMKDGRELFPNVEEYFMELVCDFCSRHSDEATQQRHEKTWELLPSKFKKNV